jgi:hypothetical protein
MGDGQVVTTTFLAGELGDDRTIHGYLPSLTDINRGAPGLRTIGICGDWRVALGGRAGCFPCASIKSGRRIMLFEFGGSLLFAVSVTLLKDFDGLISLGADLDEQGVTAFVPPFEDFAANCSPLYFTNSACHFLAPGNSFIRGCLSWSVMGRKGLRLI